MKRAKRPLLFMLSLIFIAAMAFTAVNSFGTDTYAKVIRPYETNLGLSVSYNIDNSLTMTTTNVSGYAYQYWIKRQIDTDDSVTDNDAKVQYVWELVGGGFGANTQNIPNIDSSYLTSGNKYEVMVRVKDTKSTPEITDDVIVEELFQSLTSAEVGQVAIASVEINGKAIIEDYVIVNKADLLNVKINSNLAGLTYGIYYGDSETAIKTIQGNNDGDSNDYAGSFINAGGAIGDNRLNISQLKAGLHSITVKAIGVNTASKAVSLYVYDTYDAAVRPVIDLLEGFTTNGDTTFKMYVRYADGSSILLADVENLTFKLVSGGADCTQGMAVVQASNTDYIDYIPFTVNYEKYADGINAGKDKFGIYYTVGTVARDLINGYDDEVIQYYSKNARSATLEQSFTENLGTYTITATGSIELTQNEIKGSENYVGSSNLRYAFYREDASGWVLIKDYPKDEDGTSGDTLTWAPLKNGNYNIQVRVKDVNAGSYEKAVTSTYTVGTNTLTGISVNIYDYETQSLLTEGMDMVVGKPYKIEAAYNGTNYNVFYMFTLTNDSLGTVYLNHYTPSPYYIFIPSKTDDFVITARAISKDNYGFKDISTPKSISAVLSIVNFRNTVIGVIDALPDELNVVDYNSYIAYTQTVANTYDLCDDYVAAGGNIGDLTNYDDFMTFKEKVDEYRPLKLVESDTEAFSLRKGLSYFTHQGEDLTYSSAVKYGDQSGSTVSTFTSATGGVTSYLIKGEDLHKFDSLIFHLKSTAATNLNLDAMAASFFSGQFNMAANTWYEIIYTKTANYAADEKYDVFINGTLWKTGTMTSWSNSVKNLRVNAYCGVNNASMYLSAVYGFNANSRTDKIIAFGKEDTLASGAITGSALTYSTTVLYGAETGSACVNVLNGSVYTINIDGNTIKQYDEIYFRAVTQSTNNTYVRISVAGSGLFAAPAAVWKGGWKEFRLVKVSDGIYTLTNSGDNPVQVTIGSTFKIEIYQNVYQDTDIYAHLSNIYGVKYL